VECPRAGVVADGRQSRYRSLGNVERVVEILDRRLAERDVEPQKLPTARRAGDTLPLCRTEPVDGLRPCKRLSAERWAQAAYLSWSRTSGSSEPRRHSPTFARVFHVGATRRVLDHLAKHGVRGIGVLTNPTRIP
jgi:hypothetical protein